LYPCTAESAPVSFVEVIDLFENDIRLAAFDPELTDSVVGMDLGVAQGYDRHSPQVIVSAVGVVNDTMVVCLDNSEIFVGAAAGNNVGLVALGKLHGDTEADQSELAFFEDYILS
jgi:hypothetical protein